MTDPLDSHHLKIGPIALVCVLAALVLVTPAMAEETTNATSFAEAFFISHSVDAFGARRIEWLGSLVIWVLMATSIVSLATRPAPDRGDRMRRRIRAGRSGASAAGRRSGG